MEKVLGKIQSLSYGFAGYDDAMFGLAVNLSLDGGTTGVGDFKGWWPTYPERAQYTEAEWKDTHFKTTLFIIDLLRQAKKTDISQLVGVAVEAEIDGNALKSWRILTEVL